MPKEYSLGFLMRCLKWTHSGMQISLTRQQRESMYLSLFALQRILRRRRGLSFPFGSLDLMKIAELRELRHFLLKLISDNGDDSITAEQRQRVLWPEPNPSQEDEEKLVHPRNLPWLTSRATSE